MHSSPMAAIAARPQQGLVSMARRRAASVSQFIATTLLTGAVFLLPATGARHEAQASTGAVEISTFLAAYE